MGEEASTHSRHGERIWSWPGGSCGPRPAFDGDAALQLPWPSSPGRFEPPGRQLRRAAAREQTSA
eukprot:5376022-Pyramimonas_sp.AAC.1